MMYMPETMLFVFFLISWSGSWMGEGWKGKSIPPTILTLDVRSKNEKNLKILNVRRMCSMTQFIN